MLARTLILALAGGALASACSKTEPPPPKSQAPATSAIAPARGPDGAKEIDEGLKERLARQEAAARMFEKNVLNPPPPKVPEPPPEAVKAATPPPPPSSPAPTPVQPPSLTRADSAKAEPPKVAARTEPPNAATAPAPAPIPESGAPRLLSRVDPDFPREATQAGVEQGSVKARLTLDAGGSVTKVEIVDAIPRRVFDRAVVRALSQWRYSDGAAGRTVDMEVAFKR
jgi:protein TonB